MDRPRDRYGRPLPPDADASLIVPSVPERTFISGSDAWEQAQDYLARDLPFHAHEVFEQRWRCCPEDERDFWQALAQWGAALTHAARGNPAGARTVAARAEHTLHTYTGETFPTESGVDVTAVIASCQSLQQRETSHPNTQEPDETR